MTRALGINAESREAVVSGMLERHASEGAHYWIQILLAMGIATMGLVLNSTAVVIGAMLISPLMGPIVELGMGLVVGSAFLTIRSAVRVLGSIAVVILCAALATQALPFHEITPEIAARTAPTLLDLLIAVLCALAAAFTAARNSSDGSTAAGTAIGIALVPPLCVIGYGIGTGQPRVATGATLLFTANLSAIVFFAVLVFLLLEYEAVPTTALEAKVLSGERAEHRMERTARALRDVFGVRYGALLRFSMPLVLVIAVYVPLRQALEEVAWQVRVRAAIGEMLRESSLARNAVRSIVAVERHVVDVRLVIVGSPDAAIDLERDLRTRITRVASVEPTVDVTAVPDFASLRQTVAALERPAPTAAPVQRAIDVEELRARVARGLRELWPAERHGPVLAWSLSFVTTGDPRLDVVHDGAALDGAAAALLSRAFESERHLRVTVRSMPRRLARAEATPEEGARWLPKLSQAIDTARLLDDRFVCVTTPSAEALALIPGAAALRSAVDDELARLPTARRALFDATGWSVELRVTPCPPPPPPPVQDAGADAATDASARHDTRRR